MKTNNSINKNSSRLGENTAFERIVVRHSENASASNKSITIVIDTGNTLKNKETNLAGVTGKHMG